jgi:hypothetical protein
MGEFHLLYLLCMLRFPVPLHSLQGYCPCAGVAACICLTWLLCIQSVVAHWQRLPACSAVCCAGAAEQAAGAGWQQWAPQAVAPRAGYMLMLAAAAVCSSSLIHMYSVRLYRAAVAHSTRQDSTVQAAGSACTVVCLKGALLKMHTVQDAGSACT